MNPTERKAALNQDPLAKRLWFVVLGLIAIWILYGIVSIVTADTTPSSGVRTNGTSIIASIYALSGIFFFALIFRLSQWIAIIMWMGVVGSIIGLQTLTFHTLFQFLMAIGQSTLYTLVLFRIRNPRNPYITPDRW